MATWTFDRSTGYLAKFEDAPNTILNNDNYFVPIPEKTRIETDRLVMAFEGSSVKPLLPDIRANST